MNLNHSLEIGTRSADPDLSLVQEFNAGRISAFDLLYERHSKYVYNICLGMMGNPEDARDAMQETFVQVYRSLPKFLGQSKFATWMHRIAVNKCLDALRSRPKCETTEDLDLMESAPAPGGDPFAEEHVRKTVQRLSADYRALIVLHYFQQLSYQEIAETLDLSADQVRARLHRARKAFRLLYEESETR